VELKRFNPPRNGYLSVGRDAECHITINDPKISRFHLTLVVQEGQLYVTDDGSTNRTFINKTVLEPYDLYPIEAGDEVNLGQTTCTIRIEYPEVAVTNVITNPDANKQEQGHSSSSIQRMLESKGSLTIGRADDADVPLPSLQVSRKHALLEKRNNAYFITDLNSKNGTFINGERITATRQLTEKDRITIANYDFQLKAEKPVRNFGLAIVANNVKKVYPNQKVGLNMMSIRIPSKTFVALMGPSGCGKSTLLKGLNGSNPFSQGSVYMHGIKLDRLNFNQIKRNIGYVPQDNVLHEELSVNDSLYFAAKLRMAEDVTEDEIQAKMNEVLRDLNINNGKLRTSRIKELSGGQKKRVAIAIELLNDPTILFLDEPTSPLDPETIAGFLKCIRQLNEKGVTVVMVTHKPEDLEFVDKVLFLSGDGNMVFFDDKDQLLPYFKQQAEHHYLIAKNSSSNPTDKYDSDFSVGGITDIYKLFKRPDDDDEPEIADLRRGVATSLINEWLNRSHKSEVIPPKEDIKPRYENLLYQFFWLSRRYAKTKWNDRANLLFLLLQPAIIGGLIAFVYDKYQIGVIFLTAISAIWFGVNNAAREIVDETSIYMRERMLNMSIGSYLASKILILSVIGLAQIGLFLGIIFARYTFRACLKNKV
jgi:ABC-type multidrug transport system ATPase subunit